MVLWFIGMSVAAVWLVFSDQALDWRMVAVGALIPDAVDLGLGGARIAHSVLASATLLAVVMLGTRGRRQLRRRLLALPMGTFLHLVFDGAWMASHVFWWPALGASFQDAELFSLARPPILLLVQELVGLGALVWGVRQFRAPVAA